jgi:hypothetical protein
MLTVNQLKSLLQESQTEIPGLNKNMLLLDDSELTNFLKDLKTTENCVLIGIMPQFLPKGTEDSIRFISQLQFMILKKSADKDFKNHDEYLAMFQETQDLMMLFVQKLFGEKMEDLCGGTAEYIEESLSIYPVWRKAQCNGWALEIDLLS